MLVMKGILGGLFQVGLLAGVLLVPARLLPGGTWYWPRALQLIVVYGVILQVTIVVFARIAPASLEARLQGIFQRSQPVADRVATWFLFVCLAAFFVSIPVDVFYLQLFSRPPAVVSALGAAGFAVGYGFIVWALYVNAFAAPTVHDQSDRGQELVDSGPYAWVRHPFYTGALVWMAGMGLWLESFTCLLLLPVMVVALAVRIAVEERHLRTALSGYSDYADRVRYRLVPFVW
jgi:protein-S-isoprenylcysteine O-methyltransferase Ste14